MIQKTQKLFVVVESPTKVHTISKILEELGYCNATVMASIGHTTKIKDKRGSYKNTGIYPENQFKVEWEIDPDKYLIIEKLRAQARVSDIVLIASDPDREGESLGNHIKNLLNLADNQYYRVKYHSITKESIQQALENPEKMDTELCDAAESRQIVDKMIGYALSPIAKAYVGARSVGRCQSAGLKIIADREHEIQNFVPEHYYELFLHFNIDEKAYKAKYIGTNTKKVDKITSTDDLIEIKLNCANPYVCVGVSTTTKKESPKPPFCTSTFQQEAATKLNLKVKDAMSCAQKLFEAGYITYMRTDSTDLDKTFLKTLKQYITGTYGKESYRGLREVQKSKNVQEGHEALRVTNLVMSPEMAKNKLKNELLYKVYALIWQRTVAAVMPDAGYTETSYLFESNKHLFKLPLKNLVTLGFKIIYGAEKIELETKKLDISEGYQLKDGFLEEVTRQTQPPARYKEATLVKELQRLEIGRPSTYATIVETILSPTRGYCEVIDNYIIPTDRGLQLAGFLDRAFSNIINLEYTKKLEDSLDLIATGNLDKLDFLQNFYSALEDSIAHNKENVNETLQLNEKSCPVCNAQMVVRRSRYGKLFYGCSQYPACRGVIGID